MKVEDRGLRIEDSNMKEENYPQIFADWGTAKGRAQSVIRKRTTDDRTTRQKAVSRWQRAAMSPELKADG